MLVVHEEDGSLFGCPTLGNWVTKCVIAVYTYWLPGYVIAELAINQVRKGDFTLFTASNALSVRPCF